MSTEAKVGAASLAGLVLFLYMMIYLGGLSFGERGYPVNVEFSQVSGLKAGGIVRYSGVAVGHVSAVHVVPDGVKVQLMINNGVNIPKGAKFSIGTDGLLGEKFIDIVPPRKHSGFIEPKETVKGEEAGGLDQMIATAELVLSDARKLIQALNDVIADDKTKNAIKESVINFRDVTANLTQMTATLNRVALSNEQDIGIMVTNLKAISADLRTVSTRVDRMVASLDNNGETAKDLRDTIHNLKTTSARVEKMAASLEGVVTDPETAKNIKDTLRNARDASARANRLLEKVENVSVQPSFEVLGSTGGRDYRSNMDVRIRTSATDFAVVGVSGIGEENRTNFQLGRGDDRFAGRVGVIESKAGIGLDARLGAPLRFSVDVYDPSEVKVKLRTEIRLAPDTFLVGQTNSINRDADRSTFVGVRRTF